MSHLVSMFTPIDRDGDIPLLEGCDVCGGTGKLVDPPDETECF